MHKVILRSFIGVFALVLLSSAQQADQKKDQKDQKDEKKEAAAALPPADSTTEGSVTVGGQKIAYRAVAGTITDFVRAP